MVLENGVWTQETADVTHQSSNNLAKFLIDFLPKTEYVFDFGCGNAFYISKLEQAGFTCMGFEGFPLNNFLSKNVNVVDLTEPIRITKKGSVISLEVGEHLPKAAQETFMQTVTDNCNGKLVLSWAEIGQPGLGHINCRDINEVIADVESRGFVYLKDITMKVRATIEENTSWFQRTLLLFERK